MFSQGKTVEPSELTSNSVDEEFLTKAYRILEKNYLEPEFSASQFASEMFVSRSLMYKKIRAITDLNITDFINSFKLRKAVELIRENKQPISEVAFQVGFNDPKYFSRIFKKFYGMSPSEFSTIS
jgi:AraC-like DNA-binding protein